MECIKEKKFLFWRYKIVNHKYNMHRISKFMSCSTTFHVDYKCEICGLEYTKKFVTQDELLLSGISSKDIKEIDDYNWHYCNK